MTDHSQRNEGVQLPSDDLDLLDQLLLEQGVEAVPSGSAGARPRPAQLPLSFSQELLWMLDRSTPGLTAYNMPIARRLVGALDVVALRRALDAVVARHETLRTRFVSVDDHAAQVVDAAAPLDLRVVDVSSLPTADREAEAARIVRERARTPFDLAHEHVFRATLVRLSDTDHVFLIETHHIVFDGWSGGVLFDDLATAYSAYAAGKEPSFAPLPMQYADYAVWQREHLSGQRLSDLLGFWRKRLGDVTEPLALPSDLPRSAAPGFTGARRSLLLPASLLSEIKELGKRHDATLYMTMLAAYMTVLHRYSGRGTVLVGSGIAGRTDSETERLIGYFNNTLVQRGDFPEGQTFAQLLAQVREGSLDGYDHQAVPLEKLVLELRDGQDRFGHAPLFEVVFTMQNTIGTSSTLGDIALEPFGVDLGATKFDLTLLTTERDEGLWLALQYRTDLFEAATIDRLLGHLRTVLESAVRDASVLVSEIPLLTPEERQQLVAWNATSVDEGGETTVVALVQHAAARVPSRVAVRDGERALDYATFDALTNQLAHRIQALQGTAGVDVQTPVGLCMDRSADTVVALVAILKSGAPYVPLPPDLPATRIAQRVSESGLRVVVTTEKATSLLPQTVAALCLDRDQNMIAAEATSAPRANVDPDALAYILYTSGSTGVPKGVGITHRNIVHYARAVSRVLAGVPATAAGDGFAALDGWTFGLVSTLGADLGNTSLFPSLCAGGTLVVFPSDVTMEPARFADAVAATPLDVLKITPNHLRALVAGRHGAELAAVLPKRWLVLGGEAFAWDFAAQLVGAERCRVLNHYGPTETTVGVSTYEVTAERAAAARAMAASIVPIGMPLTNTRAYVLDAHAQQVPVGVPGELYLGGAGVAVGYVGQPTLTDERFLSDPVTPSAGRVYRTGDRVRRKVTGELEFLGRVDDQVKIRGYRLELGDVEHELAQHAGVAQCAVVVHGTTAPDGTVSDARLVAYVVGSATGYAAAHAADRLTAERVTEWMRERVPEYMVPSTVILLEALPLNANGKVDRRALPAPDADASGAAEAYVAPAGETETSLAAIWAEVLKKEQVGATENFFSLGGHSLLAIRVLGKLSKQFGIRLPLRTLFDAPTVQQLAVVVDRERGGAAAAPAEGITARARDAHRIRTSQPGGAGSGAGTGGVS